MARDGRTNGWKDGWIKDASRHPLLCSALLLPGFDFIAVRLPSLPPSVPPSLLLFRLYESKEDYSYLFRSHLDKESSSGGGELAFMLILDDDEEEEEANFRANSWSAPLPSPLTR